MYKNVQPFGINIYGKSIGEVWLSLVKATIDCGELCSDEGRLRFAIRNVRIRSDYQNIPDNLIHKFGNNDNLKEILNLTFQREDMYDIDINPSLGPSEKKSYYYRIKKGRLIDFVVARLSEIPESKKAVIVFPTWEDYRAVLNSPKDDYLPCIVSIQFRMQAIPNGWQMDTIFYARSIDAFQKAYGNFWAIAQLSKIVASKISENRGESIKIGSLDGVIVDSHIYNDTVSSAKNIIKSWQKYKSKQSLKMVTSK